MSNKRHKVKIYNWIKDTFGREVLKVDEAEFLTYGEALGWSRARDYEAAKIFLEEELIYSHFRLQQEHCDFS